jgi:predicted GNAT family N-acyltransferase
MAPAFTVRRALWERDLPALRAVREAVFVHEQNVPPELEWDDIDAECTHVLAEAKGDAIGTGRLLPDGHIGRMAVLAAWRGQGVGSAMLDALIAIAHQRRIRTVVLNAQTHARHFYERRGFRATGAAFMEAGIPHITMILELVRQG